MVDHETEQRAAGASTDPRRARTREAIIRAGQELFSRHPSDGVSMEELCKLAAVSKQTFYNHFVDKDALAHELLHIARADLDILIKAAIDEESDPAKRVAFGLCVVALHALTRPDQAGLIARLPLTDVSLQYPENAQLVAELRSGLNQGRLDIPTIDSALALLIGISRALINRILIDGQLDHAIATSQHIVSMVLRAFGIQPQEAGLIAAQAADRIIRG